MAEVTTEQIQEAHEAMLRRTDAETDLFKAEAEAQRAQARLIDAQAVAVVADTLLSKLADKITK